ncbi:hypothetical protein FPV67DRAFT_1747884 [Lyophyllum atratum]|nr:hypothetical protein FPV67DRAFT_1747884 [Lyophyllum atratum]
MNHNSPPLETLDYPPSSSMSESDSLSDSDWLDISSNRESDDNDSVISGDSDREDVGLMPLSRRSSMSVGSSRDGDVEAWEGFVDDSGDEEVRNNEPSISEPTAVAIESAMGASELVASVGHDLVEEQRMKEALDQSLTSTLSASRSSTGSTHTSLRDLRLSFPDPLTSSRDELNRSYEDVSPSETTFTTTDVPTDDATDTDNVTTEFPDMPLCKEVVPGLVSTTPEVNEHAVPVYPEDDRFAFDVVLYGSQSAIKWSFVRDLVQKAVHASGLTLTDATPCAGDSIRYIHLQDKVDGSPSIAHFLPVHDRTQGLMTANAPLAQAPVKRPSLAILYLPSAIYALPEHTLYLPVLIPPTSAATDKLSWNTATDDWNSLSIPPSKVARLSLGRGSPIVDSRDIGQVQDIRAHRLFQRLLSEAKKRSAKSLSDHLSPVHAVTLFALMSLIVGFTMNTAFRRSSIPTPTSTATPPATTFWGMFGPEVNHTSTFATTARVNAPAITTHKDFSLSIFNPGTTSLAITSNNQPPVASTSAAVQVQGSHSNPSTGMGMAQSSETAIRPEPQSLTEAKPSMMMIPSALRFDGLSGSKSTALSLVVDSLSEVLDVRVARLRNDLDELVESLDELGQAILRQTKKSKGKAKEIREEIREHVYYRHDRARGKAKQMKKMGEEIIYSAGEQLVGRTNIAKQKARDISKHLAKSESWRSYQKVHAEWVAMFKEKGGEGGPPHQSSEVKCRKSDQSASTSFFSWSYAELYFA